MIITNEYIKEAIDFKKKYDEYIQLKKFFKENKFEDCPRTCRKGFLRRIEIVENFEDTYLNI